MKIVITPRSQGKSVFKFTTLNEEKPYRGYRIRKVLARNSRVIDMEAFFCECDGKRTVLASSLALAKRAIDAREGYLKEGVPENENKAP